MDPAPAPDNAKPEVVSEPDAATESAGPMTTWAQRWRGRPGEWLTVLLLLGAFAVLFGRQAGSYALWDSWEPKYGLAVRTMFETGDFIVPHLDNEPRWTKPILIYWCMAASYLVLGDTELTYRLPSIVSALFGLLALYVCLRQLRDRLTAVIGACVLGTIPQYFYLARQAVPEMLLCGFLAATMACFALAIFGQRRQTLWFCLAYASVAMATLAKGPLACAITGGAMGLYWLTLFEPAMLLRPRQALAAFWHLLKAYRVGWGLLIFVLIAAPWYVTVLVRFSKEYLDDFIGYENLQRFSEPVRGHEGLVSYYLQTIFHGMYPWCSLLPLAVAAAYRHNEDDQRGREGMFFGLWCLVPFLLFTAAGTKLQHYILPATPALAVLAALGVRMALDRQAPRWMAPAFLVAIVLLLLPLRDFALAGNRYLFDNFQNKRDIDYPGIDTFLRYFFWGWVVAMVLAYLRPLRVYGLSLGIAMAFANGVFFSHYVLPAHTVDRTLREYVDYYKAHRPENAILVYYGDKMRYSAEYYLGPGDEHVARFYDGDEAKLLQLIQSHGPVYILIRDRYKNRIGPELVRLKPVWREVANSHVRYALWTNCESQ